MAGVFNQLCCKDTPQQGYIIFCVVRKVFPESGRIRLNYHHKNL